MKWRSWFVLCAALLWVSSSARADDVGDSIDVTMSSKTPNQYFFRGLLQRKKGPIMQAQSDIRVALYDSDTFKFVVPVGVWASLHPNEQTKGGNVPASWYESRMYGGLGIVAGGLDVNGMLVVYSSPNGSFNDIYELKLDAAFRDDTIWAADDEDAVFRGIFPRVTIASEVSGARDAANVKYPRKTKSGTYAELAIAPRARLLYSSFLAVDAELPIALGMSLSNYYEMPTATAGKFKDQFLGFASVGAALDINPRFVPERLGLYNIRPSLDLLFPTAQSSVSAAALAMNGGPKVDSVVVLAMLETFLYF